MIGIVKITYQVEWTDLNGANGQTALSDGTSPAVGFKALNICQVNLIKLFNKKEVF